MSTLKIEAHCIEDEFEKSIKENYGIVIVDRQNEPWSVTFSGDRSKLIEMVSVHWGEDRGENIDREIMD